MKKLKVIGHIAISEAVRSHRFFIEAQANAMLMESFENPNKEVVGTYNSKECELYGWAPNVYPHRDSLGWMYAVCLDEGISYIHSRPKRGLSSGPSICIRVQEGDVFRLDDFCEHWTEDVKPRVAAFVGVFETPCDVDAMALLREGLAKLERGDYYGAPRVRDGFRAILEDEAYVANDQWSDCELMLIDDVPTHRQLAVQLCAQCRQPAVRLDSHWPYHQEQNRCREHLNGRTARGDCLPNADETAGPADLASDGRSGEFESEVLAGDAPPAVDMGRQSRSMSTRAHEAPELSLVGDGALS